MNFVMNNVVKYVDIYKYILISRSLSAKLINVDVDDMLS